MNKTRRDDYHRRIERLKEKGKYEDYLAKRRNQARNLYEKLDEDECSKRREKERIRFKKRMDKIKEEGTYRAYLDKCNAKTREWRKFKKCNGVSIYGLKSREQVLADGRARYRRRMEKLKREGAYEEYLQQNRIQCQSYRDQIKKIKNQITFVEAYEVEFKTPFVPEEEDETEAKTKKIR